MSEDTKEKQPSMRKWNGRNWAVYDREGNLVCVTVYKKGAREVVRRI